MTQIPTYYALDFKISSLCMGHLYLRTKHVFFYLCGAPVGESHDDIEYF